MSTSNDGVFRYAPIPLDSRGLCYIQGRKMIDAGGALQTAPIAVIGNLDGDVYPTPMAAKYIEVGGAGLDFHNGTATVDNLGYDARLLVGGASAVAGGSKLGIGCDAIMLGGVGLNFPLGMDVVVAGAIVVPSPAPFMGTYTATAAGGFTLPAAQAGQRFTLVNATAGALAVGGVAYVNAGGGAVVGAGVIAAGQLFISSYATAAGVWAWRASTSVPGA